MDIQGRDRPESSYFFLGDFFAFGVKGAGGADRSRLRAASARLTEASSMWGAVSFFDFSIYVS